MMLLGTMILSKGMLMIGGLVVGVLVAVYTPTMMFDGGNTEAWHYSIVSFVSCTLGWMLLHLYWKLGHELEVRKLDNFSGKVILNEGMEIQL